MPEWVRVKDPDTGHYVSMSVEQANLVGAKPIADADAVSAFGAPLPPKFKTTVDEAAAKKGA